VPDSRTTIYSPLTVTETHANTGYADGWFQVAFEQDLAAEIVAAGIGPRRLMLLRDGATTRAFGADCPHRGANLACGGRRDGAEHIVCPFHGYRIRLGDAEGMPLSVPEYRVLSVGAMTFVRLGPAHDNGWPALLHGLAEDHVFVPGFAMEVDASAETVIENAFDRRHFDAVHGIATEPFEIVEQATGALGVRSRFRLPETERLRGEDSDGSVGFHVTVASPGVAAATLTGPTSYTIVTGATPTGPRSCTVRITLVLPVGTWGPAPAPEHYGFLLDHSRRGLDDDAAVWASLSPTAPVHLMCEDEPILRFHRFCERFRAPAVA
jgi:phenylpropionate dioxygenase-like ring-hydroxylating dioxygenase large terminal subunit